MPTTNRDLIDDLRTLEADLRTKADDYLRSSKSYTCRSNSDVRAGLVKGAAVMRINADRIGALIGKHTEPASGQTNTIGDTYPAPAPGPAAVAEVFGVGEEDTGHDAHEPERSDQAQGQVDVPSLWTDHDGPGSGSQDAAE